MQTANHAVIDRFRDYVSISIGDSKTYYLSPGMAERLANEITKRTFDIEHRTFLESQVGISMVTSTERSPS